MWPAIIIRRSAASVGCFRTRSVFFYVDTVGSLGMNELGRESPLRWNPACLSPSIGVVTVAKRGNLYANNQGCWGFGWGWCGLTKGEKSGDGDTDEEQSDSGDIWGICFQCFSKTARILYRLRNRSHSCFVSHHATSPHHITASACHRQSAFTCAKTRTEACLLPDLQRLYNDRVWGMNTGRKWCHEPAGLTLASFLFLSRRLWCFAWTGNFKLQKKKKEEKKRKKTCLFFWGSWLFYV